MVLLRANIRHTYTAQLKSSSTTPEIQRNKVRVTRKLAKNLWVGDTIISKRGHKYTDTPSRLETQSVWQCKWNTVVLQTHIDIWHCSCHAQDGVPCSPFPNGSNLWDRKFCDWGIVPIIYRLDFLVASCPFSIWVYRYIYVYICTAKKWGI